MNRTIRMVLLAAALLFCAPRSYAGLSQLSGTLSYDFSILPPCSTTVTASCIATFNIYLVQTSGNILIGSSAAPPAGTGPYYLCSWSLTVPSTVNVTPGEAIVATAVENLTGGGTLESAPSAQAIVPPRGNDQITSRGGLGLLLSAHP